MERLDPDKIAVGDIVMCYAHDDQCEQANARVESIKIDRTPGVWKTEYFEMSYAYRVWLTCRHISSRRQDAKGGPEFVWHCFPWNKLVRVWEGAGGIGGGPSLPIMSSGHGE